MDMMQDKSIVKNKTYYVLGGVLIGVALFFLIYGVAPLIPTNLAYIYNSEDQDLWHHQLGFDFFRISSWGFPIGKNTFNPYPYESSVIYSDSIPILAIIFKLMSGVLPDYFQYLGIWILICFAAQGLFAMLILRHFNVPIVYSLITTPFFVCNVPLLFRCFHHCSLAGQWLILAAFYLALNQKKLSPFKQCFAWTGLCGFTVLIHVYLFIIIGMIMTASCVYQILDSKKPILHIVIFGASALFTIGCYYIGGGMLQKGIITQVGFGDFSMDLVDMFNPSGFSSFFAQFDLEANSERSSYFGIGIILLLLYAFLSAVTNISDLNRLLKDHRVGVVSVAIVGLLFFMMALGPIGCCMDIKLYDITPLLPEPVLRIISNIRSTVRFIWPTWYLILLAGILVIVRFSKNKMLSAGLAVTCLILQFSEIIPQLVDRDDFRSGTKYSSEMMTAFNGCFNENAHHIAMLCPSPFIEQAVVASHNHMTLNSSIVGRGPMNSIQADIDKWDSGMLEKDTLYVIPYEHAYYINPIVLPDDYHVYVCGFYMYIFNEDLINTYPRDPAFEISNEAFYQFIYDSVEQYGKPEKVDVIFETG